MSNELTVENHKHSLFTVENAAWIVVGFLAAGLRFYQLGVQPLNEGEAVQALAAFRFTQAGSPMAAAGTNPLLFAGNMVGFSLMGASEITARWLPALAGLILALLPYGLRHRLGRGGALAASLLLALSPSAVFFSRSLDAAVVTAACGLALVVGLINYIDTQRPGYLYGAAVALGLGLSAGSNIFSLLLIFAVFALLLYLGDRLLGHTSGWGSLVAAWDTLRSEKGLMVRASLVLVTTFALTVTALALHPAGLGLAADLLGSWAQSFLPQPDGQPILYPILLALRYEAIILLLGLVEAAWVLAKRRGDPRWDTQARSAFPLTAFLAFWAAAAALIVLISGHRPAGNILLVTVPLTLLAGQGIERAVRWVTRRDLWPKAWLVAAIALCLLVFVYLQMVAYGEASPSSVIPIAGSTVYTTFSYLMLALVALLLLIGLGIVVWIWQKPALVLAGGWLVLLVVLGLFGFKAMWGLNIAHAGDPRELMIIRTTDQDIRTMVAELERLSLAKAGDSFTLPITVDSATGPVVAWYLREFKDQAQVDNLSAPPITLAAVTLTMDDPPIGETFRGQGFPLRAYYSPWGLWGQDLVRWLITGDSGQPIVDQEAVLWVASQP